jgi:ribose 5-phosphate isomerase B
MKRFDIITEIDARSLERGDTVELSRHGHITPLAQDTLKERRITVEREGRVSASDATLAPVADIRSVAVASDHTGVTLRRNLVGYLRGRGLAIQDLGTHGTEPVDYPDLAALVARAVARGEADAGIVIDGAGIGVRAVMATSELIARYAREHNGANVLTLGATLVSAAEARAIVSAWLSTSIREPRYIARLAKIRDLERGDRERS